MLSLRLCVVMAAAIIGFSAAQTCSTTAMAGAYTNNTGCTAAVSLQSTLCTCTSSTWNSSTSVCSWSNAGSGNYSGVASCLNTFSVGINTLATGTLTAGSACSNDYTALRSCLMSLQSGSTSLWNATGEYAACKTYATTVFTGTAGSSFSTANMNTACPSPLTFTIYVTFGGNWTYLLSRTSRRARARATSSEYNNVVSAIMADMARATGYTPTSVMLQPTAAGNCLATIVMPISTGTGQSFVTAYASAGAANSIFSQTSFWFSQGGGIGSFSVLGAGTSSTPFTAAPSPTPSPSGASVATVAHVVLAVLALVLLA